MLYTKVQVQLTEIPLMQSTISPEELETLTDVLKEYLTDLRSEILDTDDYEYKQGLKHKDEVLRVILAKMERERQAVHQLLKVNVA